MGHGNDFGLWELDKNLCEWGPDICLFKNPTNDSDPQPGSRTTGVT